MKERGRPKCPRRVEHTPGVIYFTPRGVPLCELEVIFLAVEELEAAAGIYRRSHAGRCCISDGDISEILLGRPAKCQEKGGYCLNHRKGHRDSRWELRKH